MAAIVTHPETDEYGFAPTRIVRVRWSPNRAVARFYRVWMKPDNLDFPAQERLLIGAEHIDALMKFLNRGRQPDEEIRLDAHPTPPGGGVYPEFTTEAPGEVGASGVRVAPHGDWPEDFKLENGYHFHHCVGCEQIFYGHQERALCRVCAGPQPEDWPEGEHDDDALNRTLFDDTRNQGETITLRTPGVGGVSPNFATNITGEVEPPATPVV